MPHIRRLHIMKEVGHLWKQINQSDLEHYKAMAMKDLERFKQ